MASLPSSLPSLKSFTYDREERKQHYQAHLKGLNAYERHKKFLNDYGRSESDSNSPSTKQVQVIERRQVLFTSLRLMAGALFVAPAAVASSHSDFADMPALRGKDYGKTKMRYPDYTETDSGLQFKDLRVGIGPTPKIGDTVVVDWDGYTIGYYGRIFEARNKTKGGSFEGDDKDFFKFRIGSQEIVRDVKFTVNQTAVEPVEKGITKFNEKIHEISQNIKKRDKDQRTKDDSDVSTSSPAQRVIRGIDDPLLTGSMSDGGASRGKVRKHHRRKSGYASESGGENSSDQSYGGYMIRGGRWIVKE